MIFPREGFPQIDRAPGPQRATMPTLAVRAVHIPLTRPAGEDWCPRGLSRRGVRALLMHCGTHDSLRFEEA